MQVSRRSTLQANLPVNGFIHGADSFNVNQLLQDSTLAEATIHQRSLGTHPFCKVSRHADRQVPMMPA